MKNKMMRLASKLTVATMVASMLATVMPASAADLGLVSAKDTMSRLAVSATSVTHDLVFNTGTTATDWANTETIIFDYNTPGFTLADVGSASVTSITSGSATYAISGNKVTVTCTDAGGCYGTVVIPQFTGTNPGSTGEKDIEIDALSTSDFGLSTPTDQFSVVIVDDDQVTINASIAATMTFDIDTTLVDADTDAPYAVEFGTLTASDIRNSGDQVDGDTDYIWLDLTHNATGGAVVTVKSANAGLASISVPTDEIVSDTATYAAGAEHYGMCVTSLGQTSGTLAIHGDNEFATCGADAYSAFDGTTQNLLTNSGAIFEGRAQLTLATAISSVTPAHPDYSDTLTFVATATF